MVLRSTNIYDTTSTLSEHFLHLNALCNIQKLSRTDKNINAPTHMIQRTNNMQTD